MSSNQNYTPQPQPWSQVQPVKQQSQNIQVKFDPGQNHNFDKAMSSLDDMYNDMFTSLDSKGTSGTPVDSIDDMYSEMMGGKTKAQLYEEKKLKEQHEQLKKEQEFQLLWQQQQNYVVGIPVYNYPADPMYQQYPPMYNQQPGQQVNYQQQNLQQPYYQNLNQQYPGQQFGGFNYPKQL